MKRVSIRKQLLYRRRGTTAVLVAVTLPVLIGMAAMTIDVGHLYNVRAETQIAADAAALAAASQLPDEQAAIVIAQQFAAQNIPGHGLVLAASDVQLGNWDSATAIFTPGGIPSNAVSVITRRAAVNGNPVELFFASVFGILETDVSARAVATATPPLTADLVPLALPAPGFGPVDENPVGYIPGQHGPSEPQNGAFFEIGEEVTIQTMDTVSGSGRALIPQVASEDDIKSILSGTLPPIPTSIADQYIVDSHNRDELLDRLGDGDPTNDTVVMPIVRTLLPNPDGDIRDNGVVIEVIDFVAITVTGFRDVVLPDPDNPGMTRNYRQMLGTVVRISAGSGNGAGTTSGTLTAGSVTSSPQLVV